MDKLVSDIQKLGKSLTEEQSKVLKQIYDECCKLGAGTSQLSPFGALIFVDWKTDVISESCLEWATHAIVDAALKGGNHATN